MSTKIFDKKLTLISLGWFVFLIFIGYASVSMSSFSPQAGKYKDDPPFYRWDSNWYISIADSGYNFVADKNSNIAFFPAYPLVIKAVNLLTGIRMSWAGFYASLFFAFSSVVIFYKLLNIDYSDKESRSIVIVWLLYPFSFYLVSVYSESLFIFLELLSLFLARKGKWKQSSIAATMAVLVRPYGILLMPVLLCEYILQKKPLSKLLRVDVLSIILMPIISLMSFVAFSAVKFQAPFAFVEAQKSWGRVLSSPLHVVVSYLHQIMRPDIFLIGNLHYIVNLFVVLFSFFIFIFSIKKIRASYLLLAALFMLPTLLSGTFTSAHRYFLAIFPLFIVPAIWLQKRKFVFMTYIAISLSLLAYFASAFVRWAPIF